MLAGDLQLSHSSGAKFKSSSKLFLYENPLIYPKKFAVGYAGHVELCLTILDFFIDPVNFKLPKKNETVEFIVLTEDGKMFTFNDPRKWIPVKNKHYAIGSGMTFAMGAMEAGKTPEEAVRLTMKLDKNTGFGVSKIEFK